MLPFYYVRSLEKVEIALLDMFNNLRVNKYTDITRTNYTKTVKVPVHTHSDKNFANHWRNRQEKKKPLPIPCAGLRFEGITPNTANRTQATYNRNIYSKSAKQWISDIQPTPYYVRYSLEFLSDNRADWGQLIENTIPYFNQHRTLRIREFDFYPDIERKIPVYLEGVDTKFEDELESGSSHRFIRFTLNFRLDVDLYRPLELPEVIKYAEMNINSGDYIHKHQVLVYPDPIAENERKEWEELAPSTREGFSLLKTIAGTLVKEIDIDGKTTWKEITAPDAVRPVGVPDFKQLSLNFDDDVPLEDDSSGFGRDYVALNDANRTYVPDLPPGSGQESTNDTSDNNVGYAVDGAAWNQILTWFGTESGENGSPFSFGITLQFTSNPVSDTIFQTMANVETDEYLGTGLTLPAGEVFFEWGLIANKLYFNMRTVEYDENQLDFVEKLAYSFTTENEIDLNDIEIYKFSFVLYDKGHSGMFGYTISDGPTIPLNTVKE
jgi:hypothetical protein